MEVTITLTDDDKKILENLDGLRFKGSIKSTHENQVMLKVADAAIATGFIEPYQPSLLNKVEDQLQKINEIELRHRSSINYKPYTKAQMPYSKIVQMTQENPSVVAQLNHACQDQGFYFVESHASPIEIYRTQDDTLITLAGFSENQLEFISAECDKILTQNKVQEPSSANVVKSSEAEKRSG